MIGGNRLSFAGGAGEHRRSLLLVGGHTLGRIGSAEAVHLECERCVERRRHHPVVVVQRVLRPADGALRTVRKAAGDLQRALEQLFLRVDAQ